MKTVTEHLLALADAGNAAFTARLAPGVDPDRMLGCRIPQLRRLARTLRGTPEAAAFLTQLPHRYYDENNLHGILLGHIRPTGEALDALERFLPHVDNWATCDSGVPAVFKKHKWPWHGLSAWRSSSISSKHCPTSPNGDSTAGCTTRRCRRVAKVSASTTPAKRSCNVSNTDLPCPMETNRPDYTETLTRHGIRPTAVRLLIYKTALRFHDTFSMSELEDALESVDKSTVFRTLSLFAARHLLHEIEDGSGSTKYCICRNDRPCGIDELHCHFHCEACRKTFCLDYTHIPAVRYPAGFEVRQIDYLLKGLCPDCRAKRHV